jgi:hypothetical protein
MEMQPQPEPEPETTSEDGAEVGVPPEDAAVAQALEDYLRSEVKLPPKPFLRLYAQRLVGADIPAFVIRPG